MKKILLLLLVVLTAILAISAIGLEHTEHILVILSAGIAAAASLSASSMFAKELGAAMKLIAFGMIIVAISWVAHAIPDIGLFETGHTATFEKIHHSTMAVAFIVLMIGFYRVYQAASRVAAVSSRKNGG